MNGCRRCGPGTTLFVLCLLVSLAWMLAPLRADASGIQGSIHDFSYETGPQSSFRPYGPGVTTVCSTCHIMHHSTDDQLMWNHTLSSRTLTFGTDASTFAGTTLPTDINSLSGTTKYCLSCHDGTVAVGDVINGTDWGSKLITDTDMVIAPGGSLFGNHPVAIPYPDQAGATYNGITSAADPSGYVSNPLGVKIYGKVMGNRGIECNTCHDIHNISTVGPLLRSGMECSSCHIK